MPWKLIAGRRYFYRTRRADGRVFGEYLGRGPVARLWVAELERRKADRALVTRAIAASRAQLQTVDELLRGLLEELQQLTQIELRLAGFHYAHRNWRRQNHARHLAAAS
jgi:hypothetical protein